MGHGLKLVGHETVAAFGSHILTLTESLPSVHVSMCPFVLHDQPVFSSSASKYESSAITALHNMGGPMGESWCHGNKCTERAWF